ncbi:hypothetical protein ACTXT7_016346 [Hymenolepis weldensis]
MGSGRAPKIGNFKILIFALKFEYAHGRDQTDELLNPDAKTMEFDTSSSEVTSKNSNGSQTLTDVNLMSQNVPITWSDFSEQGVMPQTSSSGQALSALSPLSSNVPKVGGDNAYLILKPAYNSERQTQPDLSKLSQNNTIMNIMSQDPYGFDQIPPGQKIRFVGSYSLPAEENIETNGETSFNLSRISQHYLEDQTEQVSTYLLEHAPNEKVEEKNSLILPHAPSEQPTFSVFSSLLLNGELEMLDFEIPDLKSPPEDQNLPVLLPSSEDAPFNESNTEVTSKHYMGMQMPDFEMSDFEMSDFEMPDLEMPDLKSPPEEQNLPVLLPSSEDAPHIAFNASKTAVTSKYYMEIQTSTALDSPSQHVPTESTIQMVMSPEKPSVSTLPSKSQRAPVQSTDTWSRPVSDTHLSFLPVLIEALQRVISHLLIVFGCEEK